MKLSRLTNRQLRNLLRKGEVRFALTPQESEKLWDEVDRKISEMLNAIYTKAWPIRYKIESLLAKTGSNQTKNEILRKFKDLKITCDELSQTANDIRQWHWDNRINNY